MVLNTQTAGEMLKIEDTRYAEFSNVWFFNKYLDQRKSTGPGELIDL